jgi:hypothetical protein
MNRAAYEQTRLSDAQTAAIRWLADQPGGPAKVLAISEDWSSDCRRDIPAVARLAEAGGLELRIFNRDGQRFSRSHRPSLAEAPDSNADLMAEFLNEKDVHQNAPRPGETAEQARARSDREFAELQASAFFQIWRGAALDTMLSLLHERLVVGSP